MLLLGESEGGEGFPGGSNGKESASNVGDLSSIPGLVRFPGEGNGNLLQYPGLENSTDRGVWPGYIPWGHKESDITEQLSLSGGGEEEIQNKTGTFTTIFIS